MSDESLVDLLLVRLGSDEERERVHDLLVKELGFSDEAAREAVDSSPTMLREGLPMGKARVIQNRLYPYVDLLPRMDVVDDSELDFDIDDEEPEEESKGAAPEPAPEIEPEQPVVEPEVPTEDEGEDLADELERELEDEVAGEFEELPSEEPPSDVESGQEDDLEFDLGPAADAQRARRESSSEPDPDIDRSFYDEGTTEVEDSDDTMVVTSASEEMKQIERCHICGRTPSSGERLAPCRTCEQPTCRDCFDRTAHVCRKCATEGKYVDRPPQHEAPAPQQEAAKPTPAPTVISGSSSGSRKGAVVGSISVVVVLLIAAGFYFLDPLNLFAPPVSSDSNDGNGQIIAADTSTVDTTAVEPDTAAVNPDTTEVAPPDTVASQDTVEVNPDDPLALSMLSLPEGVEGVQNPGSINTLTRSNVRGITILREPLVQLEPDIALMAASVPIQIDAISFFETDEGNSVLALSVLHPEEDTKRYQLLRLLGDYLEESRINELVFYYSESQYYHGRAVCFPSQSFPDLIEAVGPYDFSRIAGCNSDREWELLTGPVQDWMTGLED